MFLGHYGLALAAKRAAPRTSLGASTFAAQFLDELWPILLLLGIEQVRIAPWLIRMSSSTEPGGRHRLSTTPIEFTYYPFSHSLVMAIGWGVLIGAVYFLARRYGRGAWIMAALVVSHWFLDVPMHRHDLPLWPAASSPLVGWGLWNHIVLSYLVELVVFLAGVFAYARVTRARDRIGSWGFWAYVAALVVIFAASDGPPPPSERVLAWTALGIWLFIPWAWWIDRHRYYTGRIDAPLNRPMAR